MNPNTPQIPPNHVPQTYNLSKDAVKHAKKNFQMFDANNTGSIDMSELANALAKVFSENGLPPPAPQDVAALLSKYDVSGDQQLNKKEFSKLLKELAGHKKYDKESYKKQEKPKKE